MKKFYISVVCLALGGSAMAQKNSNDAPRFTEKRCAYTVQQSPRITPELGGMRADTIWSDSFDNASDWVIAHEGPVNVDWQIGVGLENTGDYPTNPVESTTASDGYAMLDSDAGNNSSTNYEFAHMTTANPIDLSAYPNAVLSFQTFYRMFTDERPLIQVSTNNTDWLTYNDVSGSLISDFDITAYPGVYDAFPGFAQGDVLPNPHTVSINISDVAGGASQVWVRFLWVGLWGYSWFVDDVVILEQAMDDMRIDFGYVANNQEGIEYGRMPSSNVGSELFVGGQVTNFGVNAQNNIVFTVEILDGGGTSIGTETFNAATMASGEMMTFDGSIAVPALPDGQYTVTYTLVSDEEQAGEEFGNNTAERRFDITASLYSLDAIDVVDDEDLLLSSYGTNSFEGAADGFMVMSAYNIMVPTTVYGIDVLLANGTIAGGQIAAFIFDTLDVFNDPNPILSSELAFADYQTVTQDDIDNGMMTLVFSDPVTLDPNQYYAAVEMLSNGTANTIRVLDDTTVPQPAIASAIYHVGDNVIYSNGNAFAVRLNLDMTISVPENEQLTGISMFPNPTDGRVTINMLETDSYDVEVIDMLGARVMSDRISGNTVIDLSGNASGVYMVRISNEKGSFVERITLK